MLRELFPDLVRHLASPENRLATVKLVLPLGPRCNLLSDSANFYLFARSNTVLDCEEFVRLALTQTLSPFLLESSWILGIAQPVFPQAVSEEA
jgi:hypothetical protein